MDGFKRPPQKNHVLPPVQGHPGQPQQPRPHAAPTSHVAPKPVTPAPTARPVEMPVDNDAPLTPAKKTPRRTKKSRLWVNIIAVVAGMALVFGAVWFLWYQEQLKPVDPSDTSTKDVVIVEGATFAYVADSLEQKGLVRSAYALDIYAMLHGKRNAIQQGTCKVSPSESVSEIIDKLTSGCHDFKSVTFYPGATIEKPLYKPPSATLDQTMYVKYVLQKAGYSDAEISAALSKQYSGPLFADKPAGTTLEGYVFGETYHVDTAATAEQVLQTAFDQMYKEISDKGLVDKFRAHKLNLYQAITLASIVQRELNCEDKPTPERKERCHGYQKTIAQIFLKRLDVGMSLGSDVTFIYAADMRGVAPTVNIDSPYNTRIHPGLPPGPIASPGILALDAVANPTDTDYLFFIAGDDGLIYFAKNDEEHQQNIKNHCQKLCNEL